MAKEIEFDEIDLEIFEHVFDEDMIESLCREFEEGKVKELMEKLEIEFKDVLFPSEEDE